MFNRNIVLPAPGEETFFLWGSRQTGKSTLLRERFPRSRWLDLLRADEFRRYAANPEFLRQEIEAAGRPGRGAQVVIDEIQKVPALLDEVHWLIENRGLHFALCGSSARKVRRGAANLLGGRAVRYEMHGLTADELGDEFDLSRMLNHGYLPRMYQADRPARRLDAYVADYLKEEIAAEGHGPEPAGLLGFPGCGRPLRRGDDQLSRTSPVIARCRVPPRKHTSASWRIRCSGDGSRPGESAGKRRLIHAPKFYFFDVGVVNRLARTRDRWSPAPSYTDGRSRTGSFTSCPRSAPVPDVRTRSCPTGGLAGGTEVDFVLGDMRLAVEAKASARIALNHLRGLRSLAREHPEAGRRVVVCLEPRARRTDDGIDILPAKDFVRRLRHGDLAEG